MAARAQVPQAVGQAAAPVRIDRLPGDGGDTARPDRGAVLVGDHGQLGAGARQAQDGLDEIGAMAGVDPAGAQYQVRAAAGRDGLFAGQLGAAVGVQRMCGVGFPVGAGALAVEHVVGGIVHQQCIVAARIVRHDRHRLGIDAQRQLRLGLGAVDFGIGGGVDQYARRVGIEHGGQPAQVAQVGLAAVQRGQPRPCRRVRQQRIADLSGAAQQQDVHVP
ncbi:Uncharacterised protein [Bordetella pertussis]|nr:Uncharacterised protein [Bordetella pertussis]CFM20576.1 Uncharacterised protein [Bordetella pertussis]CFM22384.1 Uncharacterised protein [Bordetella pertussis]CFM47355.1 Uncharacterised protein [Bordetella pertussis]CFM81459.1 Uncharacterised protein [Bordetella pertussis]